MMKTYLACDIVFTASRSTLGRLIRWATQSKGEAKSEANHTGLITWPGSILNARITEALWHVEDHNLYDKYHGNGYVAVFRPKNLTPAQKVIILAYMKNAVGQRYGWWKLLFHLGYKLTGKDYFRNFLFIDKRPICSYLVARAYEEAGLYFGQVPGSCTPDDMMDFCWANPDKYEVIHLMEEI